MGFGFLSDDDFETMCVDKLEACHDDMIAEAGEVENSRREDAAEYRAEAARERG
jgi:hypothetical protein